MDSILSVPLLTPSTRYSKWKMKMIASLKRQGLYEIYIGCGEKYYEEKIYWLIDCDRDVGAMCMTISPSIRYLIDSAEYPKDL